ncbi:MAG TPA: HPP family protein [Methylophilus sp.]
MSLQDKSPVSLLDKLQGEHAALPPRFSHQAILLAWLGAFVAMAVVGLLTQKLAHLLILGSFGASCVILFAYPDAPFAQPRNTIGGHFLSSLVGLTVISLLGVTWWTLAIAVATAVALMMLTRTVHPPAGSNPVIVWLMAASHTGLSWDFLWFPTLFGAIAITIVSLIYNNLTRDGRYPKYWI